MKQVIKKFFSKLTWKSLIIFIILCIPVCFYGSTILRYYTMTDQPFWKLQFLPEYSALANVVSIFWLPFLLILIFSTLLDILLPKKIKCLVAIICALIVWYFLASALVFKEIPKPECEGTQDGTYCAMGFWYDEFGRICGGGSCVGLGTGKCFQEKCMYTEEYEKLNKKNFKKYPTFNKQELLKTICAEKGDTPWAIDIRLTIDKKDNITVNGLNLFQTNYGTYCSDGNSGLYRIVIIDKNENILFNEGMDIYFGYDGPVLSGVDYSDIEYDTVPLDNQVWYDEKMHKLMVLKLEPKEEKPKLLFSEILDFCNQDGICSGYETRISCWQDCPSWASDGLCIPHESGKDIDDGCCDPDCAKEVDADCSKPENSYCKKYYNVKGITLL